MKIDINRIPAEGFVLEENIPVSGLDLETEIIKFRGPINIKARVSKITNAVSVDLNLSSLIYTNCSRCLKELEIHLKKNLKLNYLADRSETTLDLGPDIREEIIVDYPLKPLCKPDCQGLCPKCGKNLNEGGCCCATT